MEIQTSVSIEKISSESSYWAYESATLQNLFLTIPYPPIILFLRKTMFIFSYILSAKIYTSFLINLKLKKIMYLNVTNGRQYYLPRTKDPGI
jgi:hypothetical protein